MVALDKAYEWVEMNPEITGALYPDYVNPCQNKIGKLCLTAISYFLAYPQNIL